MSEQWTWQAARRPASRIGHTIEAHATIGSTNDRARALIDGRGGDGIVVVAEEQTAGRGRRGRTWVSPAGVNLTASIALRPALDAPSAWRLGPAASVAVHASCAAIAPVALKWPNDVVSPGGLKLGGLLLETAIDGDRLTHAVVGIGLNVNWSRDAMPAEIAAGATSLSELAGRQLDRAALLRAVLERLEEELDAVEGGISPLARYRAACATIGAEVEVQVAGTTHRGVARGIDEAGALVVESGGRRVAVANGEVLRVRPLSASR